MASQLVAGDTELAVYQWTKTQAAITAIVKGQIGFALPNKTPPLPYLVLTLVSETVQPGEAMLLDSRIQFSCWGLPSDKATVSNLARAVQTAGQHMSQTDFTTPQGTTRLHGAVVDSTIWLPDPDNNNARYTVDLIVTSTTLA